MSKSGVVLVDKPPGVSSAGVVQRLKRLYGAGKAGHTGSLDPLATGMLPICLDEATKFAGYLLSSRKIYRVSAEFGAATATGDGESGVVATGPAMVDREALLEALDRFRGDISQTPPMYSALKRGGQPLYRLARAGQVVPREPRLIRIYELSVEVFDPRCPVLRVHCSKGTYVRTLIEDIARAAGTVAHVTALRRLAVEPFTEGTRMWSMADLQSLARGPEGSLATALVPMDEILTDLPAVTLTATQVALVSCGRPVSVGSAPGAPAAGQVVRLYNAQGRFLGVGSSGPGGELAPRRLLRAAVETNGAGGV